MSSRSAGRFRLTPDRGRPQTGRGEASRTSRQPAIGRDRLSTGTAPAQSWHDPRNWDRELKRLRTVNELLGFTLLTVIARLVIDGVTPLGVATAALIIVLLVISLLLTRQGGRLRSGADRTNDPPRPR